MSEVSFEPVNDKKNMLTLADQIAQEEGLPPEANFSKMVTQESSGNMLARSPKGAIGLSQLMPKTARELKVNPFNPIDNLRGGARYLKQQYDRFGDWGLAHAAYNSGPENVEKYGGIPPFEETQNHVKKIMGEPQSKEQEVEFEPVEVGYEKVEEPRGTLGRLVTGAGKNIADIAKGAWSLGETASDLMLGKPQKAIDMASGMVGGARDIIQGAGGELRKAIGMEPSPYATEEQKMAGEQAIQPFKQPLEYAIDNPVNVGLAVIPGINATRNAITASRMANVANVVKVMDRVIDTGIAKGVRPLGQAGRRTVGGVDRFQNAGREVVKDIVANKDVNVFTDMKGDIATNKVPHTVAQTVDAVDQGLTRTARTYLDAVERVTGQKVITPMQKVIDDLKVFVDDPVNQMANPTAVKYAKGRIKNFEIRDAKGNVLGTKELDPSQLETLLQSQTSLRKQLINNPTKDIDRLHVEGMVNKSLREIQDGLMTKYDGPEYRQFKNKYAAYKQLEGDVIQRNKVVSRQGPFSLIDFSDVYTLPKIIGDAARGDFVGAGKGVLAKVIAKHHKWANKPDTAIKNMFTGVDELASKYPGSLP